MRKLTLVNVHLCLFPLALPSKTAKLLGNAFHAAEQTFPIAVSMPSFLIRLSCFFFWPLPFPERTYASSLNVMDNGILNPGLTAKVEMKHIFPLLLFVLIQSNSSCHKFQQITKEKVNSWQTSWDVHMKDKRREKTSTAGEDIYQTNWD